MQSSYKYCTRNRTQKTWIWDFTQFLSNCSAKSLQSCPTLYNPMGYRRPGSSVHGDSPGKNTEVSCPAHPPGDLPDPGIKPTSLALAGGFFTTSTTWGAPSHCRNLSKPMTLFGPQFPNSWTEEKTTYPHSLFMCINKNKHMWDIQRYTERYRHKHTHIWGLHKKNRNYVRDLLMFSRCLLTPAE